MLVVVVPVVLLLTVVEFAESVIPASAMRFGQCANGLAVVELSEGLLVVVVDVVAGPDESGFAVVAFEACICARLFLFKINFLKREITKFISQIKRFVCNGKHMLKS